MPRAARSENHPDHFFVFCPACECAHLFDHRWTFSGTLELPTFRPSMLVNPDGLKQYPADYPYKKQPRCHSFVTNGQIQFLPDCEHAMKGQTVDLPEY